MLTAKELLGRAQALEPQLVEWRRTLHRHPEVGFDLTQTKALVKKALTEMGYEPKDCGKAGVIALAGGKKPGKTILLRGRYGCPAHSGGIRRGLRFRGAGQDARLRPRYAHGNDAGCCPAAQGARGRDRGHRQAGVPARRGDLPGLARYDRQRPAGKPQRGCGSHVPCAGRNAHPRRCGAGACLRRHHHGKL